MNQQGPIVRPVQRVNPLSWALLKPFSPEARRLATSLVVTVDRADPAHLAFDILRTKVLQNARDDGWQALGITAPTVGCGKATIALNLAFSLAKQRELKIVLVDLDLRHPRIGKMLGIAGMATLQDFLRGECPTESAFVRIDDNLAIGATALSTPHPAELLHSPATAQSLKRLKQDLNPDIIVYNLPPMLTSDDCIGLMPHVETAILVVGAEQSTMAEIDVCERELREQSKLLGVVLNKCRYTTAQFDNYQS